MRILFLLLMTGNLLVNHGMAQVPLLGADSLLLIEKGVASYYGKSFHKRKTASGDIFDMNAYTAAHQHLPFGTMLKVENMDNGYVVIVKVNDRLPQGSTRIIDLSRIAAEQLDMVQEGLIMVGLYVLSFGAIEQLLDYYEEVPAGMRLRLFNEPISWAQIPKPDNSFVLNKIRESLILVEIHSSLR